MTKILKSGKKALSFVVAFAVIAVSLFVAIPAINLTASAATLTATDKWDGNMTKPTDTTSNPGFVTINNAEEFAWVALAGGAETLGVNYKVKAGQVFDMGGMTGITTASTAADVKAATTTGQFWRAAADNRNGAFQGSIDGNGVIIFNAQAAPKDTGSSGNGHSASGLFPYTISNTSGATQTIKNIKVVASEFRAYHYAGAIVGEVFNNNTSSNLVIANCEVSNTVVHTQTHSQRAGVFVGQGQHGLITLKDVYAHDNVVNAAKISSGTVACFSTYGTLKVEGAVILGISPLAIATAGNEGGLGNMSKYTGGDIKVTFSGAYTDASVSGVAGIISNNKDAMTGTACANLDFAAAWLANAGVPELRVFHNLKATNTGEGHTETCTRCDIQGLESPHNYTEVDYESGTSKCACGASQIGILDSWDGQKTEPTATDEAGNIVIKTAEELAWVALKGGANTAGKNYIVVPNARFNMNGMAGITINSTAAEVENKGATTSWALEGGAIFQGNFDGNGLIVYNIHANGADGDGRSGLFPKVDGNEVTIKNTAVYASYFRGYHAAGALVGRFSGAQTKKINFINCETANCYIYGTEGTSGERGAGGLIGDLGNATPQLVENCYVHDNKIVASGGAGAFIGKTGDYIAGADTVTIKNSIAIGISPLSTGDKLGNYVTKVVFENVYTDQAASKEGITGGIENWQTASLTLDLANVWFANTTQEPVLRLFHNIAATSNGASGHTAACADCDLVGLDEEAHDWSANDGTCPVCGYECDHANATDGEVVVPGDCTTDKEIAQICECGAAPNKVIDAEGHKFGDIIPADPADCGNDGHKAHYKCSVCDKYSLTGEAFGATVDYDTEIFEAADGNHAPLMDGEKYVYIMDDNGHSYQCSVCGNPYDQHAHTGDGKVPDTQNPASGHRGECDTCGYGSDNGVLPHSFGDDNVCDECAWVCENHDWKSTGVTAGDCLTDETEGFECDICGTTKTEILDKADGHTFQHKDAVPAKCNADGKMAYEYCTVCNKKYADGANVKTPFENAVEDDDLIVTERPACTTTTVAAVPSTCKDHGTKAYDLCTVCGKKYINNIEITNPDDLIADLTACTTLKAIPADPATCTEDGTLAYDLCETCGKTYIDGVEKDAAALVDVHTGHKYDEYDENDVAIWKFDAESHWHICTICGVVDKADHKLKTDTASYEGTYVLCEDGCGYETFEHSKTSSDKVVTVTAGDGVFTKDVWTTIKDIISEDIEYSDIKLLLKNENAKQFIVYDITPDEEMAKGTTAKVTFNVPTEYSDNVAIYRVDVTNQTVEKLKTDLVKNEKTGDRTASAEVDHFSVYVLADLGAVSELTPEGGDGGNIDNNNPDTPVNGDPSNTSPATGESIAIAAIVIALIGAAFVIVRKVRKA